MTREKYPHIAKVCTNHNIRFLFWLFLCLAISYSLVGGLQCHNDICGYKPANITAFVIISNLRAVHSFSKWIWSLPKSMCCFWKNVWRPLKQFFWFQPHAKLRTILTAAQLGMSPLCWPLFSPDLDGISWLLHARFLLLHSDLVTE